MLRTGLRLSTNKMGARLCMASSSLRPSAFHTTRRQALYYFDHLPGDKSDKVNKGVQDLLGKLREETQRLGSQRAREIYDVVVVGGGIIGLATARELSTRYPSMKICVLEKEANVAFHQSGHNSGVIHAGMYYKPGTIMAHTCVRGADLMYKYAEEHDLPVERCGKLIVATNEKEHAKVQMLYDQGVANGVKGLEIVYRDQIKKMEPNVDGYSALHSPNTGIINYWLVSQSILKELRETGTCDVRCFFEVKKFKKTDDGLVKISGSETIMNGPVMDVYAKNVITCGGLYSDRLAGMTGGNSKIHRVVAFRGQYYQIKPENKPLVSRNVYPVPTGGGIPVGVHFTPTLDVRRGHQLIIGPGACFTMSREGYRFFDFKLRDVWDNLSDSQFWAFAFKNLGLSFYTLYMDLSKHAFMKDANKLLPELKSDMVELSFAGVMSQVFENGGEPAQDFIVERNVMGGSVLNVRNAPTPAATASLAIAEMIVDTADEDFGLKANFTK